MKGARDPVDNEALTGRNKLRARPNSRLIITNEDDHLKITLKSLLKKSCPRMREHERHEVLIFWHRFNLKLFVRVSSHPSRGLRISSLAIERKLLKLKVSKRTHSVFIVQPDNLDRGSPRSKCFTIRFYGSPRNSLSIGVIWYASRFFPSNTCPQFISV